MYYLISDKGNTVYSDQQDTNIEAFSCTSSASRESYTVYLCYSDTIGEMQPTEPDPVNQ